MSVLLTSNARVVVLSPVGAYGTAQVQSMRLAGTQIVAGVSPGRGGTVAEGLPLFDTVAEAVRATSANTAVIYVPAAGCAAAIIECADAGIDLALAAAEFVPVHDALYSIPYARERGMWVVGPNSVGLITPGSAMLGSFPEAFTLQGSVGVIGRSGTLTLTVARTLTLRSIGQSTVVHIGGDVLAGRNPHEWLAQFLDDPETETLVYCGEIGGTKEYAMLDLVSQARKPVVCLIAGRNAPEGKRMGHAGALIGEHRETAAAKIAALREAGAHIALSPYEIAETVERLTQTNVSRDRSTGNYGGVGVSN